MKPMPNMQQSYLCGRVLSTLTVTGSQLLNALMISDNAGSARQYARSPECRRITVRDRN